MLLVYTVNGKSEISVDNTQRQPSVKTITDTFIKDWVIVCDPMPRVGNCKYIPC